MRKLLGGQVHEHPDRGLDHGAYVPLVEMYPGADVPVIQLSMPSLDPRQLMDLGRRLAPLRDEGVLIMGSGFFTHNLREFVFEGPVPQWSRDFDDWGRSTLQARRRGRAARFPAQGPGRPHGAPAHRALRPAVRHARRGENDLDMQRQVIEGFWGGLAKRSVQLG